MLKTIGITKQTEDLKKLIAEHPDYPICVLAGEEANGGDNTWMFCSGISFSIGEILDTDFYGYNETVFVDRDTLEEQIEDAFYSDGLRGDDLDRAVKEKLAELEPYWKKVIFIWATN